MDGWMMYLFQNKQVLNLLNYSRNGNQRQSPLGQQMDLTLQQIERAELETHRQLEAELEAMVGTAEYEQLDRRARELLTLLRTLEKVRPPSWQAQHEWALRELAQIVIGLGCPAEALDSVTVLHPLCTQQAPLATGDQKLARTRLSAGTTPIAAQKPKQISTTAYGANERPQICCSVHTPRCE